ncbi:hypothetical protein SRABI70_00251 [Pseudomonas sp. Bi70]|nr:hypothetical protein SRABI70_00251 [Pseudomonas sp. Bi70]
MILVAWYGRHRFAGMARSHKFAFIDRQGAALVAASGLSWRSHLQIQPALWEGAPEQFAGMVLFR